MWLIKKIENGKQEVIGLATNRYIAYNICDHRARIEGQKVCPEDFYQFSETYRTMQYEGSGEFVMQNIKSNILLTSN